MKSPLHPALRFLALLLAGVLFLSSGPVLLAQNARSVMSPAGGGAGGGRASAANLNNAGAASAALTATRAREALQKSEASLNAMKTLQVNARNLMARPETQNGLKNEWLEPHVPGGGRGIAEDGTPDTKSWSGARITSAKDSANVVIKQAVQNAFLYWNKFNVGSKTTVRFDQSAGGKDAGKWIAFNKVMGRGSPSEIRGSILAEGQVYILNQNGIIFHNGSQVNTRGLVASTLPINENLAGDALKGIKGRGIANNPDSQFLFAALPVEGNESLKTQGFTPEVTGPIGDVVVERGASIISPANANNTGGLVALIGANVRNEGTISTPNGQTILASGFQVALTPHKASDPSLRGMDVTVGRVADPEDLVKTVSESGAGRTQNDGIISAFRGNATMAGREIVQNGGIESSTSVDLNGRIDLLASFNAVSNPEFGKTEGANALIHDYEDANTGTVMMGRGSVIRILPEWESSRNIPEAMFALPSLVTVTGRDIGLGEGSVLLAPGAKANSGALSQLGSALRDGVSLQVGQLIDNGAGQSVLSRDVGRIDLGRNAVINVAGSTAVWVDSARNLLKLQLRGAELADSPLQRKDENIRGIDLVIDATLRGNFERQDQAWVGTPLADVSGFVGLISKTVGELTTAGGSVSLSAGDAVSMAPGSVIDVSGGWIQYSGGSYSTSKLLYRGHLVDISQATPDRVYSQILTRGDKTISGKTFKDVGAAATIEQSSKWGQVKVFNSILDPTRPVWRPSYVSGAPGGSISIAAPSVALDGELFGNTVAGPRQIRDYGSFPLMNQRVLSTLPSSSSFALDLSLKIGNTAFLLSPYAPKVTFASRAPRGSEVPFLDDEGGVAALPADRAGSVILSQDLLSARGFGKFSVSSRDGDIVLPSGVTLDAGPNGSVKLQGANLFIGGGIKSAGGEVSLQAFLTPLPLLNLSFPPELTESVTAIMVAKEDAVGLDPGEKVVVMGDPGAGEVTVYRADGTDAKVSGDLLAPLPAGRVALSSSARIDVSGSVVNELRGDRTAALVPNGGKVSMDGYSLSLAPGSEVDVSGGFYQGFRGGAFYGDAGSINFSAGQDAIYSTIHRGSLALGGRLSGYAGVGSQAGSLAIKAPAFRISQESSSGRDARVTRLTTSFFDTGGFSTFSLTGVGLETETPDQFIPGVSVASGTILGPRVRAQLLHAHGRDTILPEGPLSAAPSITFRATGLDDPGRASGDQMLIRGVVEVEKGSSITLNPQLILSESFPAHRAGSLVLDAPVVSFAGSATVPGGSISISAAGRYPENVTEAGAARVTLDLAPSASLSVAGMPLFSRDPLGARPRFGTTLPGGSVSLSGNVLARAGSVIDASGASASIDLLPYQLGIDRKGDARSMLAPGVTAYRLDSDGGSISLAGIEALRSDAKLMARSGGKTAAGGTLSISSGRFDAPDAPSLPTDLGLAVSQSGQVIPGEYAPAGGSALGLEFENVDGIASGGGHIAVSSFASGGFQNLTLGGNVLFSGPVSLSVPGLLKVATKGVLSADSRTELSAKAAILGTPFLAPLAPNDLRRLSAIDPQSPELFAPPTWGEGELVVKASRIDIGNLSLQGIGKASLEAPGGAIRGNGSFVMAGELTLKAGIIYPVSGTDFRVIAYNYDEEGNAASSEGTAGSISVLSGGRAPLPLSALGSLSLHAEKISQSGTLAAPFGMITLGRSASQDVSPDPLSGLKAPVATEVILANGSATTVSGIDHLTGVAISVPFGTSADGTSWTTPSESVDSNDPPGTEITGTGVTGKSVSVVAADIIMERGAIIDLRGGGSVTSVQWVAGLGGTRDILSDDSGSWAIIPGYGAPFTPRGYGEEMVAEGARIVLKQGAAGLPPGTYTLLPASYATQPGAYLLSRSAMHGLSSAFVKPDGTAVVPGTLMSGVDPGVEVPGITSLFEISSPAVIASKSEYRIQGADTFFSRLPASGRGVDAGRLRIDAINSINLAGSVATAAGAGGRAAAIDIAAFAPILVTGAGGASEEPSAGTIVLDASVLSSWKAGSLLIGGTRSMTSSGEIKITPIAESLTVDSGVRLQAAEVILAAAPKTHVVKSISDESGDVIEDLQSIADAYGVGVEALGDANGGLTEESVLKEGQILRVPGSHASVRLSDGSAVVSSGGASPSTLLLEGNGALLRVGHAQGIVRRNGFDPMAADIDEGATPLASLVLGQDALISGGGVTLDSTSETTVDPLASIVASSLRISSGLISVNGKDGEDTGALVLSGSLLEGLSSSATLKSLSLTSYSTMILHSGSVLGSKNLGSLSISAAAITGSGGSASLVARSLSVDNGSGGSLPDSYTPPGTTAGTLEISADTLALGNGQLRIEGFQTVSATARDGISLNGKGGLSAAGNVKIKAPVIVGLGGASTGIRANGSMLMEKGATPGALKPGLGASLTFSGSMVSADIPVLAPSGSISIESTAGDLNLSALLDVGGTSKSFPGVIKYTDAGVISLSSQRHVNLNADSDLNLSAQAEAGSAGTLRLTAPNGTLFMEGAGNPFRASVGNGGKAGTFLADLFGYNGGNLNPLQVILKNSGFSEKQDLRIRSGDVTLANATARSFRLSADAGSITVTGTINASGETGGTIGLFAGRSVMLESGSVLDVRGKKLDAAGKGGLINLEAGSSPSAVIASEGRDNTGTPFASGISVIDLKGASGGLPASKLLLGVDGNPKAGTVMLKAPQTADASDLQINPISSEIKNAESIIAVGNNRVDVKSPFVFSIDSLSEWTEGSAYQEGQSVLYKDADNKDTVYQLKLPNEISYQDYLEKYLNIEPGGSIGTDTDVSPWKLIATAWDEKVISEGDGYNSGDKVYFRELTYTATRDYKAWDQAATYKKGDPVIHNGDTYTALNEIVAGSPFAPDVDHLSWKKELETKSPGSPGSSSIWQVKADEGNLKQFVMENAATFDSKMLGAGRKAFAGDYAATIRVRPGEEIVNSEGGLVLNNDWDLSLARYGELLTVLDAQENPVTRGVTVQTIGREPGLLTLRAKGDITFGGSLSDGFGNSIDPAADVDPLRGLYYAPLLPLLEKGGEILSQQSWSYRITAGADSSSALPDVTSGKGGTIEIGFPRELEFSDNALTSDIIKDSGQYQVIRTGAGDIALSAALDVQLLSPFASVYTAGSLVTDPKLGRKFDLPAVNLEGHTESRLGNLESDPYPVQYASGGGNVSIVAGRDITRLKALINEERELQYDSSGKLLLTADSSLQLPSNWLMRRGAIDSATGRFDTKDGEVLSTTWWVDYSNFFQDVGALGGGNIVMNAGRDVANVSASIPTTYRMRGKDGNGDPIAPSEPNAVELGGGDLSVNAGRNIDAGVYYVERGKGNLKAGGSIITNPTRDSGVPALWVPGAEPDDPAVREITASARETWLPTTLFLGKGSFTVQASSDLLLGPVANVFLTPQSVNNSLWYRTYFSTYAPDSSVSALSLAGNMTLAGQGVNDVFGNKLPSPLLRLWYDQQLGPDGIDNSRIASLYLPWIRSSEFNVPQLHAQLSLAPATFSASALGGGITLQGNLTTTPDPRGDLSLVAAGAINGLAPAGSYNGETVWISSSINLSDASPANLPGVASPLSMRSALSGGAKDEIDSYTASGDNYFTDGLSALFAESGSYSGSRALIETKQVLHDPALLHKGDPVPLRLIASGGDISGLTLYSGKRAEVVASGDISDVGLYIQNLSPSDISLISAGGSFRGYDPNSQLRAAAVSVSDLFRIPSYRQEAFPSGDIQISGPGTLQLLAGSDIDLGNAPAYAGDSTIWVGLTSIGNARNPGLPFQGADIVAGAGLNLPRGLSTAPDGLGLAELTREVLNGEGGDIYLSELDAAMTYSGHPFGKRLTLASFEPESTDLTAEQKALAQLQLFYIVLRDTGRNYNKPGSPGYRSYETGQKAIASLFANPGSGSIKAWSRDIRTKSGGNISLLAPGGGLSLASINTGSSLTPPGIITESGGGINIFTRKSVDIGIGRIFTLRGGDVTIWSDQGDIAAGFSAKTVASAPPTRVLIDPQSGAVETDLAGLATGGGIGVLASVEGIPPGNVDLIAPKGVIDAGDAGIRSTGNLNLAATRVLNANNISAGGNTTGAPPAPPPPAAPNVSGATAASAASAGNNASAQAATKPPSDQPKDEAPSVISVEVLGYGGGDAPAEEEPKKSAGGASMSPPQASL